MFEKCKGKYKVYVHVNKINGKIYIGQTCNSLSVRAGRKSGIGYKHSTHFYNAIQKYGWENFEHIILIDGLSLEMANIIEEELPCFKMEDNIAWAVARLYEEDEISLYDNGKADESDFYTDKVRWSEFEEREAKEILESIE